jgi:glycosyltransferase involved in cell wall biosynthesis
VISVVVPTYNCAETVGRTVNSILRQTAAPLEVIVVDDGSTDNTREVLNGVLQSGAVRYLTQPNSGVSATRNRGLREAKGSHVAFVDADDWIRPDALAEASQALSRTPGARWCATDVLRLRDGRQETVASCIPADGELAAILRRNFVERGFLFERSLLLELGGYDETMQGREDWELYIRLIRAGHRPAHAAQPLYCYAERPTSLTRNYRGIAKCWEAIVRKHHQPLAAAGDPALRRLCAEQLWILGRYYRYQVGDGPRAVACALRSIRYDPRPSRLTRGLWSRCGRVLRGARGKAGEAEKTAR